MRPHSKFRTSVQQYVQTSAGCVRVAQLPTLHFGHILSTLHHQGTPAAWAASCGRCCLVTILIICWRNFFLSNKYTEYIVILIVCMRRETRTVYSAGTRCSSTNYGWVGYDTVVVPGRGFAGAHTLSDCSRTKVLNSGRGAVL